MKERILTGWTFTRGIYLVLGIFMIIQSALEYQFLGVIIGSYFASMGLFAFGCAANNCFGGNCNLQNTANTDKENKDSY